MLPMICILGADQKSVNLCYGDLSFKNQLLEHFFDESAENYSYKQISPQTPQAAARSHGQWNPSGKAETVAAAWRSPQKKRSGLEPEVALDQI